MVLARPAFCLYLGLVLSVAYTTALGPLGFRAYAELQRKERELQENLVELERVNRELTEEIRSLSSDAETVMLLARDLGYYRRGDLRVSVQGLPLVAQGRTIGQVIGFQESGPEKEGPLRIAFLLLPIALYTVARLVAGIGSHGKTARHG